MHLHTDNIKIELNSNFLDQLIQNDCLKINGSIISSTHLMLEFEALIEEEEIVFDVYYDQNHDFLKIHTDEDYERSFNEYFRADQFRHAKIEMLQ